MKLLNDKEIKAKKTEIERVLDELLFSPGNPGNDGVTFELLECVDTLWVMFKAQHQVDLKDVGEDITDKMNENEWESLIYFHPGKNHRDWTNKWVAGTMTGVDHDLICLKRCSTREDEAKYLSTTGNTAIEAIDKAVESLKQLEGVKNCKTS